MNILERMRAGELIFDTDPEYPSLYAEFEKTMKLVAQLNSGLPYTGRDKGSARPYLGTAIGRIGTYVSAVLYQLR
mgnify:CR=1 FL=1